MAAGRIVVVSHSAGGAVDRLAEAIVHGARAAGAQVRRRVVPRPAATRSAAGAFAVDPAADLAATPHDLAWADAIAFGSPTYFGNISADLLRFLADCDGLAQSGALDATLVTGFTAASSPNGGQEAALLSLYRTVARWGVLIVPTGYTDQSFRAVGGNPYGLSVTCPSGEVPGEQAIAAGQALGRRLATVQVRLTDRLVGV